MSEPSSNVPAHREQLDIVDWFVFVGMALFSLALAYRGYSSDSVIHGVAASGWLLAASNYYTARKRYNPRLH
jgi:hypothetical protein